LSLFVIHCGPAPVVDAGIPDAAVEEDAGANTDAGAQDSGTEDAGTPDAGEPDAGQDAGLEDAGFDAGLDDAGLDAGDDAGLDAGADAGFDAGNDDAGLDAGTEDAGIDAGRPPFDAGVCPMPTGIGPAYRLRAMAANLTSGNFQSYDPGHGARIMQGVDPDVIMIQELNYGVSLNSTNNAGITQFVAQTFDGGFAYARGLGGAGNIPNGIISRWPIVASGVWDDSRVSNRDYSWARIDIPGPNDLWAISVHLLTANPTTRAAEASELLTFINANVPQGDYLLVGGDFNTSSRTSPNPDGGEGETAFDILSQRFFVLGPHPIDQNGNENTNTNRNKPYDVVLASPCLAQLQGPTTLGTSTYAWGAVIDTRVYTPMSDIYPADAGDSAATGMQHMGVVKDFFIQP
jgi:hypothetical protein